MGKRGWDLGGIVGASAQVTPSQLLFGRLQDAAGDSMCIKRDMWLSTPSPGCLLLVTANFLPAELELYGTEEIGHLKLKQKKKR